MSETPGYAAVANSTVVVVVAGNDLFFVSQLLEPHKYRAVKEAIHAEKPYAEIKAIIDPA